MSFSGVFRMDRERLEKLKVIKKEQKEKVKGKKTDKLTVKEKDELLLTIAKMLGLMD